MRWPLGVVAVVYGHERPAGDVAAEAAADGFEFVDGAADWPATGLALPVRDRFAVRPTPGCSTGPWPNWSWEQVVERYRAAPGALLEPWPGCVVSSDDACRAVCAEVPGLRLLLDVGHVTSWGGDPLSLLELADHVQLRHARPGATQCDPTESTVDFGAVLARLEAIGYGGAVAVEYFDLPDRGWPFADPRAAARSTAAEIRARMA